MVLNNNSTIFNSTRIIQSGYDLPFAGNQTTLAFYVGIVNTLLMLASFISGLTTVIISFKYNKKKFMKWRNVDRFIVYKAMNDMMYYFIPIFYIFHVTIEQVNYPAPLFCTIYAVLTNIFGFSQTLLTIAIAVISFLLIYYNRQVTMGTNDCFLYIIVISVPVVIFTVVAAFGQLGPNGYFRNFDGVKGRYAHLVIVSIGFTLLIILAVILYVLLCIKIYQRTKVIEVAMGRESLAKKRALSIAKHSSLLIMAFFIQFGVYIIDGIWRTVEIPPVWVHFVVTVVGSCGGVVNGIVFYVIKKQKDSKVSPNDSKHTGDKTNSRSVSSVISGNRVASSSV